MSTTSFQQLAHFIWSVAELLGGPYRPPQYERVMLPPTAWLDAVQAPNRFLNATQNQGFYVLCQNGDNVLVSNTAGFSPKVW